MVEGTVECVELYEDRAAVTRVVSVEGTGRQRIRIGPLTPLVRPRALSFLVDDDVVVEDFCVLRHRADPSRDRAAELARLERERHTCSEALAEATGALEHARSRASRALHPLRAARDWTPRALTGDAEPLAWVRALRQLEETHLEARVEAHERESEVEALRERLAGLDTTLHRLRADPSLDRSVVELVVLTRGPSTLRVRYTVPCAVWRPVHRAVLDGDRVRWEVGAMAWNSTGEDWRGVRLVCSTERPGAYPTAPGLTEDRLHARRREHDVEIEAREEIAITLVGADALPRPVREIPGVDDRGEPRRCTAPDPVDLPSTGRPVRVTLERWEADADVSWVAHPERSEQVVLRSVQGNAGARPLLAGPVDLIRGDTAVGRGRIGYVAPGSSFAVGWGSHDALRITRRSHHAQGRARLATRQTHAFSVDLTLVHLGDDPLEVLVRERVPVSEIAEVHVDTPEATPPLDASPDDRGLCTWRVALRPGEARRLSLSWSVDAPANVKMPW